MTENSRTAIGATSTASLGDQAVTMFLRRSLLKDGFPFNVRLPDADADLLAALRETRDQATGHKRLAEDGLSPAADLVSA